MTKYTTYITEMTMKNQTVVTCSQKSNYPDVLLKRADSIKKDLLYGEPFLLAGDDQYILLVPSEIQSIRVRREEE